MLPTIDPTNSAASVAVQTQPQTPTRRLDAEKALEAYNLQTAAADAEKAAAASQQVDAAGQKADTAGEAQKTAPSPSRKAAAESKPKTDVYLRPGQDQAEINFQLTREEREAFINAISGQEKPEDMAEEEQTALQRAAERVEKLIEEALTRSTDRGERLDKAIKEWYTRLTNGKYKAPPDLISLIQQAAAGNVNFKNLEAE